MGVRGHGHVSTYEAGRPRDARFDRELRSEYKHLVIAWCLYSDLNSRSQRRPLAGVRPALAGCLMHSPSRSPFLLFDLGRRSEADQ